MLPDQNGKTNITLTCSTCLKRKRSGFKNGKVSVDLILLKVFLNSRKIIDATIDKTLILVFTQNLKLSFQYRKIIVYFTDAFCNYFSTGYTLTCLLSQKKKKK